MIIQKRIEKQNVILIEMYMLNTTFVLLVEMLKLLKEEFEQKALEVNNDQFSFLILFVMEFFLIFDHDLSSIEK
jgi:hypothetical protein